MNVVLDIADQVRAMRAGQGAPQAVIDAIVEATLTVLSTDTVKGVAVADVPRLDVCEACGRFYVPGPGTCAITGGNCEPCVGAGVSP